MSWLNLAVCSFNPTPLKTNMTGWIISHHLSKDVYISHWNWGPISSKLVMLGNSGVSHLDKANMASLLTPPLGQIQGSIYALRHGANVCGSWFFQRLVLLDFFRWLRLNRYIHPYWPLVLSNVVIELEKLPSTGIEASGDEGGSLAGFVRPIFTRIPNERWFCCEEYTVVLGLNLRQMCFQWFLQLFFDDEKHTLMARGREGEWQEEVM